MRQTTLRSRRSSLLSGAITVIFYGLLGLSAYAVLQGLMDIIYAGQKAESVTAIQNIYIAAAAILITLAMGVTLDVSLRRGSRAKRILAGSVYALLVLWSIGFGYGFWWKIIAARNDTIAGMQVSGQGLGAEIARAEGVVQTLDGKLNGVSIIAQQSASDEAGHGSSCGIKSPPGVGPLATQRGEVTETTSKLTGSIKANWIAPIDASLSALTRQLKKLDPPAMRNMESADRAAIYRDVREASETAVKDINGVNQREATSAITQLEGEAASLSGKASLFSCADPPLAKALKDAADTAKIVRDSPVLSIPNFENNEDAAGTVKAFQDIWNYPFWLADSLIAAAKLQALPPFPPALSKNSTIALVASCAVDACIFVFGFIRVRRPLDGSTLLQPSTQDSYRKLLMAMQAFAADDKIDARRVFSACTIRAGRYSYFILPHLSSRLSSYWRQRAMFLQNILLVLEEARIVDRSYDSSGIGALVRQTLRYKNSRSLFNDAAKQLRETARDTPDGASDEGAPQASELSLHRFWRADLLEILLILRESPETSEPRASFDWRNFIHSNFQRRQRENAFSSEAGNSAGDGGNTPERPYDGTRSGKSGQGASGADPARRRASASSDAMREQAPQGPARNGKQNEEKLRTFGEFRTRKADPNAPPSPP